MSYVDTGAALTLPYFAGPAIVAACVPEGQWPVRARMDLRRDDVRPEWTRGRARRIVGLAGREPGAPSAQARRAQDDAGKGERVEPADLWCHAVAEQVQPYRAFIAADRTADAQPLRTVVGDAVAVDTVVAEDH